MTVDQPRVDDLIAFTLDHQSHPTREGDLVAAKSQLFADALGPDADVAVVGSMTRPGTLNGMIVHEGDVVAEFGDTGCVDEIASATKSFLALLSGVAVDEGLIPDIDGRVGAVTGLAEFASDHNRAITWRQLLNQTSEWDGRLFGKVPSGHRGDRVGERLGAPGSFWEYNDVRVNLLTRALLEVFGRPLPEVLTDRVMEPIVRLAPGPGTATTAHGSRSGVAPCNPSAVARTGWRDLDEHSRPRAGRTAHVGARLVERGPGRFRGVD